MTQGAFGAYLQTSVIATASLFGPSAVQSMMSGQAAVAVAVSGVQVVSVAASLWSEPRLLSDDSAAERSALIFFSVSTLFLAGSAFAHGWLVRTPAYQHVASALENHPEKHTSDIGQDDERQRLVSDESSSHVGFASQDKSIDILRVARQNVIYEISVASVFIITLVCVLDASIFRFRSFETFYKAVFPPITISVLPMNPSTHPLLFSAIHFLMFNVGDFLGRYVLAFPMFVIWSTKRISMLAAMRTLFIPLFLLCNFQRRSSLMPSEPIINSDFLFMLLIFLFGWSNGYVSSLCLMAAPSLEHNPRLRGRVEDVDIAATVASFCLVGGLVIGSFVSFAVKSAICGCNPFTS